MHRLSSYFNKLIKIIAKLISVLFILNYKSSNDLSASYFLFQIASNIFRMSNANVAK